MTQEVQQAEDAVERGDFRRASEIYRKLSMAEDAQDSLLSDFVSTESLLVRDHLRKKMQQDPKHVHARMLLAARVSAPEAFDIYTGLLQDDSLPKRERCRALLRRFDLFVTKRIIYSDAAIDFLEARRILIELGAHGMLFSTFATLARIDNHVAIPVLEDIARELDLDRGVVRFIERKIDELQALQALHPTA